MNEDMTTNLSAKLGQPELSLVLPCYNEENSIRSTVNRLVRSFRQIDEAWELVLVDNGSTDDTSRVIDELIAEGLPVIKQRVEVNQGYGHGVLQGFRASRGRLVGFTCADAQIDAQDVVKLVEVALDAGSPRLFKVRRRFRTEGIVRRIVSMTYNLITRFLFGSLGTNDINANPKILPREVLERMDLKSKDWFLDAEIVIKAKRMGLDIFELNVMAQMRAEGQSNVKPTTCYEFIKNLIRYRFSRSYRALSGAALESLQDEKDAQWQTQNATDVRVTSDQQ